MKIIYELENLFFNEQDFNVAQCIQNYDKNYVSNYFNIIYAYAQIENAIVVLSDLINYKSYICVGLLGAEFGLTSDVNRILELNSIWEEDIFNKIHPEDLFQRHLLELKFFNFLKKIPRKERLKYYTDSKIRMLNINDNYQYINHRTLYLNSLPNGDLWLSLCIYKTSLTQMQTEGINGKIANSEKGIVIPNKQYDDSPSILSSREQQVLFYIQKGCLSKEIALRLNISLNTVNRHCQNILKRLGVSNSFEAVQVAVNKELI